MTQRDPALKQIDFAHQYTLKLLDNTPNTDWFRQPAGGVSHVAWQVAHLAMAEYRLCLERIRGRQPGDEQIISESFLMQFGKDSVPVADAAKNPSVEEIRHVYDQVHQQTMHEVPDYSDEDLNEPPLRPHVLFQTKLGGLYWCGQHEMLHAGQIGLLRRLLGHPSLW